MDWAEIEKRAVALTGERRGAHILGTAEEAVRLAERWGADPGEARLAGLLHDLTKFRNLPEQLKLCKQYGIIPSRMDARSVSTLHAVTGASMAQREFGIDDGVASAIRWHTTGRAGMTLSEKILFIADYIEPTRRFSGVEEVRALAYADLNAACIAKADRQMLRLISAGEVVHPAMLEARNALLIERQGNNGT